VSAAPLTGPAPAQGWAVFHRSRASHRAAGRPPATLAPNERVLTRADGGSVVGTDRALHLRGDDSAWRRFAWTDIASATWSPATATTVLRLWPTDHDTSIVVHVQAAIDFAAFAAERVSSTQLLCRRVQLTSHSAATVTALRESGHDTVTWRVSLDPGCDRDDPAVAVAVERTLAELRALAGC
jgi:hypothetical protein